jgi:hypothetical protein
MVAAVAKRASVMELDVAARGASMTLTVHVAASPAIALVHDAPDRGRDVARGLRAVDAAELRRDARLRREKWATQLRLAVPAHPRPLPLLELARRSS